MTKNVKLSWLKNALAAFLVAGALMTFTACAEEEPEIEIEEIEPVEPEVIAPVDPLLMDTTMMDTMATDTMDMVE